jgi:hypothetical protein
LRHDNYGDFFIRFPSYEFLKSYHEPKSILLNHGKHPGKLMKRLKAEAKRRDVPLKSVLAVSWLALEYLDKGFTPIGLVNDSGGIEFSLQAVGPNVPD